MRRNNPAKFAQPQTYIVPIHFRWRNLADGPPNAGHAMFNARLDNKIDAVAGRLEAKIDASRVHVEMMLWKHTAGIIGRILAASGGLLLRMLR